MKFKKILITLPIATMGAGLLATVLTSCNNSKIDDDKKITLDDNGKLADNIGDNAYTYKEAVKWALTRSSSWATFKEALAEEIVLKWYEDRMYEDKDGKKERNKTFKTNYDEWKYQINKDYDSLVQSQKTKYGTNYKFYLQNEYLSQYGGTEETYKHAKLVEKAKSEFITNVWKFNYFSYNGKTDQKAGSEVIEKYPHIFTSEASTTVSRENLNNPENWSKIGFFASTNPSFSMKNWPKTIGEIDVDFLAKNPDGDYATIQDYVFNKYFNAVKPFYSAASLFKYSKPHGIEEGDKLSVIYSTSNTSVKVPDEPNESFPFFGGAEPTDSSKGTRMFMEWFNAFDNGDFATSYNDAKNLSNGTISITNSGKSKYSEDSQTLLLASAVEMLGGTDALYVPYATVAAEMYQNMMLGSPIANAKMNYTTKAYIKSTVPTDVFKAVSNNNPAIFKNFFFDPSQYAVFEKMGGKLNSYLDLSRIYPDGIVSGDGSQTSPYEYHCPLFKNKVQNFNYFYGDTDAGAGAFVGPNGKYYSTKSGVVFITNTMYVNDFTPDQTKKAIKGQPWALQLNQSGMHAQTIDGYDFIVNNKSYLTTEVSKIEAAKLVFKYRLMQKRTDQIDFSSGDLLGSSGKLKTYFTNNFADIILEMASSTDAKINVFREISTMKATTDPEESSLQYFFTKLCDEQKFGLKEIKAYLSAVNAYDKDKKNVETIDKINNYIYDYRSKVITTAKSTTKMKTVYGNGLLAPVVYEFANEVNISTHDYRVCNVVADIDLTGSTPTVAERTTRATVEADLEAIKNTDFYKNATENVGVNEDKAFSPQIKAAKTALSNRAWFKSSIVDKVMYAFYSSKNGISNVIKYDTYTKYATDIVSKDEKLKEQYAKMIDTDVFRQAVTTTYKKSKVITGNTTYANIGSKNDNYSTFVSLINNKFAYDLQYQKALNGEKSADDAINYQLFAAALAYLCVNNYENLYKNLNSKIGENEVACVAYINKVNPWFEKEAAPTTAYSKRVENDAELLARYGWTADVENLFDQDGYAGGTVSDAHTDSKAASNSYWNLIAHNGSALAGFTGIQSKTSNSFDSASGLQEAVFNKFAWSTQNTTSLKEGTTSSYKQNDGAWFAFAGTNETSGKRITFDTITYKPASGETETFEARQFGDDNHTKYLHILRLAKKIANYDSIEDLKTLAKTLADAYDGGTIFKQIGYGEVTYQDPNKMRIDMLKALPHYEISGDTWTETDTYKFFDCFERISNVEVHTKDKLDKASQDYCFDDGKGNGYHAYITQLNKADITEKRLHWTWDGSKWVRPEGCPLELEEFLYILCSTAAESSVQSLVITQAIKDVFGDNKLKVYDANLYNTFDSAWIKDWVKKPIGK